MPRIDAHVHGFPDRLAERVRAALNTSGLLSGGVFIADVARRVESAGFDAAWLLPYAHKPGVAGDINEWSAAEVTAYSNLVAGATFHPDDADLERLVLRALVQLRLRVVKLHCSVGNFSVDDPRLGPLWRIAADQGVPVTVHAGRESPGITAAHEVERLESVLDAHPGLKLVLAHSGLPELATAIGLMRRYPNLRGDLTPVWQQPVPVDAELLTEFRGRFLFGSDAPNNPDPAEHLAARFDRMSLSEDVRASVMGGAATGLLA
jgi:predicted TIM-barrel fold metal-dependent hydrolase